MSDLFSAYNMILLDSSFFVAAFSQELKSGLTSKKVFVAGTFQTELEQYKHFLPKEARTVFDANYSFLTDNLCVNVFDMATQGSKNNLQNDIWGMITLLVTLPGSFVVVTANRILMQRIILSDFPVDIYDLNTSTIRSASSYYTSKSSFELNLRESSLQKPEKVAKDGATLYKNDGGSITLGSEIHSGLEGKLYRVIGHEKLVAKIYSIDELSWEKYTNLKKIVGINKQHNIPFAAFPSDLLFYDSDCNIPAGFIEDLVESGESLDNNPLYLGNIVDCSESKLKTKQSESVALCLKIVRQICYLNIFGFIISDYNYANFSQLEPGSPFIQMWDVDSFGYGKYFSGIDAGYRLSREYDLSLKQEVIASCYDELYLFAFSILSLGDYPISEIDGVFKYIKKEYLSKPIAQSRKKLFPARLWNLFIDVFTLKKEPSAETLLTELAITLQELKENPDQDKTYFDLFAKELSLSEAKSSTSIKDGEISNHINESGEQETTRKAEKKEKKKAKVWIWILLAIAVIILVYLISNNLAIINSYVFEMPHISADTFSDNITNDAIMRVMENSDNGCPPSIVTLKEIIPFESGTYYSFSISLILLYEYDCQSTLREI